MIAFVVHIYETRSVEVWPTFLPAFDFSFAEIFLCSCPVMVDANFVGMINGCYHFFADLFIDIDTIPGAFILEVMGIIAIFYPLRLYY